MWINMVRSRSTKLWSGNNFLSPLSKPTKHFSNLNSHRGSQVVALSPANLHTFNSHATVLKYIPPMLDGLEPRTIAAMSHAAMVQPGSSHGGEQCFATKPRLFQPGRFWQSLPS